MTTSSLLLSRPPASPLSEHPPTPPRAATTSPGSTERPFERALEDARPPADGESVPAEPSAPPDDPTPNATDRDSAPPPTADGTTSDPTADQIPTDGAATANGPSAEPTAGSPGPIAAGGVSSGATLAPVTAQVLPVSTTDGPNRVTSASGAAASTAVPTAASTPTDGPAASPVTPNAGSASPTPTGAPVEVRVEAPESAPAPSSGPDASASRPAGDVVRPETTTTTVVTDAVRTAAVATERAAETPVVTDRPASVQAGDTSAGPTLTVASGDGEAPGAGSGATGDGAGDRPSGRRDDPSPPPRPTTETPTTTRRASAGAAPPHEAATAAEAPPGSDPSSPPRDNTPVRASSAAERPPLPTMTPAEVRAVQVEARVQIENLAARIPGAGPDLRGATLAPTVQGVAPAVAGGLEGAAVEQLLNTSTSEGNDSTLQARVTRGLGAMVNQRGGTMTMRLQPPELGDLRVQMTINDGVVAARLTASTTQAHQVLQRDLAVLRSALESHGLNVERLSVHLAPSAEGSGSTQHDTDDQRSGTRSDDERRDAAGQESRGRGERDDTSTRRSAPVEFATRLDDLVEDPPDPTNDELSQGDPRR